MASFADRVYDLVRSVPPGRVVSYGAIARALGAPRSARQVGWALHRCPDDVPAHRVVNHVGRLSGGWAFGSPAVQRMELEAEGVQFLGPDRCNFDRYLWHPPSDDSDPR